MVHDFKRFPELTNSQMQIYYFDSPHKQITEDFRAKVIKVTDGDTIRVLWDQRDFSFPIRFLKIAAPELNESGGVAAQRWLASRILGQTVDIAIDFNNRVEKWGRLLGEITFQGMSMGEEAIRTGHAIDFKDRAQGSLPNLDKLLEVTI